jgi:nucleoside triphosphatase YtkD
MIIKFYDTVDDDLLKFAVIVSMYQNQWVLCKHKQRNTYELPGGHREAGEDILSTAKRELFEETGAVEFTIKPICVYSVQGKNTVIDNDEETFGMLYFADITAFSKLPEFEMEKISFFDDLPDKLTYPQIQPQLVEKVKSMLFPQHLERKKAAL